MSVFQYKGSRAQAKLETDIESKLDLNCVSVYACNLLVLHDGNKKCHRPSEQLHVFPKWWNTQKWESLHVIIIGSTAILGQIFI